MTAVMGRVRKLPESGILFREIGSVSDGGGDIPPGYHHIKLFVIDGTIEVLIDGKGYVLQRGHFADCISRSVSLRRVSPDARAYLLLMSDEFMCSALRERRPFSPAYIMRILQNPVLRIPLVRFSTVMRGMENIRQAMLSGPFRFSEDILQNKVLIFFLELAGILEEEPANVLAADCSKHQKIFIDFLRLLPLYIRREHTVNFYADQLHITPQYLRRIVKALSGYSAYQVISNYLNREICQLLLDSDLTLQEIAEQLSFSDQAVLSKFFKRNNGLSPLKYRNERR